MGIIDTHAHLTCDELYAHIDEILARAQAANVERILCVCLNRKETERAFSLKERYAWIDIAVGFHPSDLYELSEADFLWLEEILHDERVIAVGEIGLDYHWDDVDKATQQRAFVRQLEMANAIHKPVLIHMRDATKDTLDLCRENKRVPGILHCFSGSRETAEAAMKMGFYLSVGGPLTFKNARGLPQVMATLPLDRIMVETDCPYLTPHPYRGVRNEPMYIVHTVQKLAKITQLSEAALQKQLKKNYEQLFSLTEC